MLDVSYGKWGNLADFAILKAVSHTDVSGKQESQAKVSYDGVHDSLLFILEENWQQKDLVIIKLQPNLF